MLFQMICHVGVILDRVQINPRQQEVSTGMIAIIWLVHVPEKN
jgi:hypothetical protein